MRQPNTHHLRKLIERVSGMNPNQTMTLPQKEALDISFALNDLLLYQRELEQENRNLRDQLANADKVDIEMQGGSF